MIALLPCTPFQPSCCTPRLVFGMQSGMHIFSFLNNKLNHNVVKLDTCAHNTSRTEFRMCSSTILCHSCARSGMGVQFHHSCLIGVPSSICHCPQCITASNGFTKISIACCLDISKFKSLSAPLQGCWHSGAIPIWQYLSMDGNPR